MTSLVSAVSNAFMPNSEISDPALFAGRRHEVANLAEALHAHGSCPLIIGHRGLGKTSLALQIGRIAMADVTLLEDIGRSDLDS